MLNSLNIRTRFGAGFALIFILMVGLMLYAVANMKSLEGKLEEIVKTDNVRKQLAQGMLDIVQEDAIAVRNALLQKDRVQEMKDRLESNGHTYEASIKKIEDLTPGSDSEGLAIIAKLKAARKNQKKLDDETIGLAMAQEFDEAFNGYVTSGRSSIRGAIEAAETLIAHQMKRSQSGYEEAVGTYHAARTNLFLIGGSTVALGGLIAFLLATSITSPLSAGLKVVNRISGGDLSARIAVRGKDEIAELLKATNQMADNLRALITNALKSSYHVAITAEKVATSSGQIAASAQEDPVSC